MSPQLITVGADPELFLVNVEGKFISSIGIIGGSKKHPRDIGEGCAVQEDNVAVEFNIPPAKSIEDFIASTNYALEYLTKYVAERNLFLSVTASKSFTNDQLDTPQARRFGCDADFNAWTKKQNSVPRAEDKNLRSCGGHAHLGFPNGINKIQVVRWFAVTAVLPSVLEDQDTKRRELYGKAGAFRGKSYGVECRALSNYWIQTKELMEKIYKRGILAVTLARAGHKLDEEEGKDIQHAINSNEKALAGQLWEEYSRCYPEFEWI